VVLPTSPVGASFPLMSYKKKNGNNRIFQYWQTHNQSFALRNAGIFKQKLSYIHDNPVAGFIVENPAGYI
jgi:hypothetical protein